ncbi:sodium:solute symporter family protein [Allisonella histaminiformans]|uniref:sodium:solute symporter family protein n=1 Tax=Allisonella histaminiformans TaxID=209880 RepID=UPI00388FF144
MNHSLIQILIICAYIGVLFLISGYVKMRSAGSSENYVLAGRKMTTPLIMVSIIGLAVGGASTIGVAEQAYTHGLSAGWYTAAWGIGAIIMGLTLAKKYRRMNITTVSELLERYYGRKTMAIGIACQILVQLVIMSLQFVAGGAILSALLPDVFTPLTGMLTSAVVFIGITLIGGMWSASQSNLLNVTLQYMGIAAAAYAIISMVGGMPAVQLKVPEPQALDFISGVGPMTIITWIVVLITVNLSLQAIIQISLGAKDVRTAQKGFLWGGVLMLPVGFASALLGVIAAEVYPNIAPATALPRLIMTLNPWLAGVTLASLWAADVSTACNLLLSAATLYAHDIHRGYIDPSMSEQKQLRVTRAAVLLLGLLTLGFALTISGIITTLMAGLSLMTAFAVIVLMTMYAPQHCSQNAALWTLLVSILVLVVWMTIPASHILPHVIYAEWIACVGTFCLVSLVERAPIPAVKRIR